MNEEAMNQEATQPKRGRGRPEEWSRERVLHLIQEARAEGLTVKAYCAKVRVPYITVTVARRRHGLQERDLRTPVSTEPKAA